MVAVKSGDIVRIVLEGEVRTCASEMLLLEDAYYINPGLSFVKNIEVLKSKLKVGDQINGRNNLHRLPEGSVVTNAHGIALVVAQGATLGFEPAGSDIKSEPLLLGYGIDNSPYTVRYIPE